MRLGSLKYFGISLALVTLWVFFVFLPMNRQHIEADQRAEAASVKLADFNQTISKLQMYIESFDELKRDRQALDETLYTKDDVLKLFEHLKSQANKYQLSVDEITPPIEELLELNRNVADSTRPLYLNIGVKLSGQYKSFGQFVRATESSSFYQGTNTCQIMGGESEREALKFDYRFTALLGYVGEKS